MQGKPRRHPAPPTAAGQLSESPATAAGSKPSAGGAGVHYDADELFPDSPRLSVREQETLELIADGKTNGVIATVMGNSKRTVEDFITKIMEKLKVADRNEAMALYHQAVVTKLVQEKAERDARIRALEEHLAALRRQLRRSK
jgi:DNA-binding NarL/FixJ family response regulator